MTACSVLGSREPQSRVGGPPSQAQPSWEQQSVCRGVWGWGRFSPVVLKFCPHSEVTHIVG